HATAAAAKAPTKTESPAQLSDGHGALANIAPAIHISARLRYSGLKLVQRTTAHMATATSPKTQLMAVRTTMPKSHGRAMSRLAGSLRNRPVHAHAKVVAMPTAPPIISQAR